MAAIGAIAGIPVPATNASISAGMLQIQQAAQGAQMGSQAAQAAPLASFQEFFADAVKRTQEQDGLAKEAQRKLLVGESDNIHETMIAMEKASLSLQLTMAVRNKVVEAYQEVMRMQI